MTLSFKRGYYFGLGVFENNNNKIRHAYSIATYLHQNITLKNFDKFLTITQTPSPFFEDTKKTRLKVKLLDVSFISYLL